MERGGRDARLAERRESRPHLAGGLVGERDDQHVARPDDAGRERVGDPSRDDPGLAAARAGQDAQRSGGDRDGLALGRIEVGQEVVGVGHGHRPIVAGRAAPAVIRRSRRAPLGDATLDACRSGVDPSAFVRRRPTTPRSSPRSWPSRRSRPGGATSTSSASGRPARRRPRRAPVRHRARRRGRRLHPGGRGERARLPPRRHRPVPAHRPDQGRGLGPDAIRTLAIAPHRRARPPPADDRSGRRQQPRDRRLREARLPPGRASCAATSGCPTGAGSTPC